MQSKIEQLEPMRKKLRMLRELATLMALMILTLVATLLSPKPSLDQMLIGEPRRVAARREIVLDMEVKLKTLKALDKRT